MFSQRHLRFVLCSRDHDVLRPQRIMGFLLGPKAPSLKMQTFFSLGLWTLIGLRHLSCLLKISLTRLKLLSRFNFTALSTFWLSSSEHIPLQTGTQFTFNSICGSLTSSFEFNKLQIIIIFIFCAELCFLKTSCPVFC